MSRDYIRRKAYIVGDEMEIRATGEMVIR